MRHIYMKIKGSMTEKNLLAAFSGESQARTRYSYFAGVAKKEGYEQISGIFLETSDNEKEHAKLFFSFLKGGNVEIVATRRELSRKQLKFKNFCGRGENGMGDSLSRVRDDCRKRRISRGCTDILSGRES